MRAFPSCGPAHLARACLFALCLLCVARPALAAAPERSVKAAFLLKFLGYADLPQAAPPGAPLVIGVVGAQDVGAELARLAARGAGPRLVQVRELRANASLAGVQVLFIGGAESERAARLLRAAARQGILAVTEFDAGLREGSVINFRMVDGHVRFEVSLAAADRAGIKLSSRLLSVAYLVEKPGG